MGLEGIVSKRTDAPYRSGASKTWVKMKNPASEAVRRSARRSGAKAELRSLNNGIASQTNVCTRRKRTCGPKEEVRV